VRDARKLALTELARLVGAAYSDPDECDSWEERRRALHLDLDDLPLEALDRERILARLRWALDPKPSSWLAERLRRLDHAASRLRRSVR
jgi:hypothetical protein